MQKARSAIYAKETDTTPLATIDAFQFAARKRPPAARCWLDRLQAITPGDCQGIFGQIPTTEISETAVHFALTMLELNQSRLLHGELKP